MHPQETDSVLDVAAGTCVCGHSFAPYVGQVTCLDLTPPILSVGKEQAEKQELGNMTFVIGDAGELPFLDNSFSLEGMNKTGFQPYQTDEGIYFNHKWTMIIGRKSSTI